MSYLITLPMVSAQHTASSLLPPSSRDQTQASHLLSGTPGGLVNPAGFQVVAKHSSSFCVRLVVPGPCLVYRHHDTQQIFIYSTTSSPELPSSKVDEEFCKFCVSMITKILFPSARWKELNVGSQWRFGLCMIF